MFLIARHDFVSAAVLHALTLVANKQKHKCFYREEFQKKQVVNCFDIVQGIMRVDASRAVHSTNRDMKLYN